MTRLATFACLALAGCNSVGTIELDLIGETGETDAAGCGAPSFAFVFAERTDCRLCACGACFGAKPGGISICPPSDHCSLDDLRGRSLPLGAGQWAVVLEVFDQPPDPGVGRLIANSCVDVTVDVNGIADVQITSGGLQCAKTCTPP